MKLSSCVSLCLLLAAACVIQATHRYDSRGRCSCNGRSQYCLQDSRGLHCIHCQGNTTGRHCERCKDGFFQQGAGLGCSPCGCDPVGSLSSSCDSRGHCSCKEGVTGQKCTRCSDGPIGPNGCKQRRQLREDAASPPLPCFCYGHSSSCSARSGFSVHPITSTFTDGPEGWRTTEQEPGPTDVLFRWSPKHQDVEVISTSSVPAYLRAPGSYLGNQLLSYGQNLSFSLRMDHSVQQPSYNDLILEGAGLQVSASLGDLLSAAPCRQKRNYTFRLDEQPSSGWRPQLSRLQFQALLHNLTSLRIRATYGPGRGYLDNVQMVSAQRGVGSPAPWVWTCSCPRGHEGDFCGRCSAGFKRTNPAAGPFSSCEPCSCRGGGCDPQTGDCYSADDTAGQLKCPTGFYQNRWDPDSCLRCPCPDGVSCTVQDGSGQPQCDPCPPGTTGRRCDVCQEGFYGDPLGNRACRPCQCNGHISTSVSGSCDRSTGECLRCLNNTSGRSCESCLPGFYHSRASDACTACDCDRRGSDSHRCDHLGRCQCKPGFQGIKCQLSTCPACFSSVQMKMKESASKVETLFLDVDGGGNIVHRPEMEAALRNMEQLIDNLQLDMDKLTGLEAKLQEHLSSVNTTQKSNRENIQKVAAVEDTVQQQHQLYNRKVDQVQKLLEEIKANLEQAKKDLRSANVPSGDAPQDPGFSALLQKAVTLANRHQREADAVHQSSGAALNGSMDSLALLRTLTSNENRVKELVGGLKSRYDQTTARVKTLEDQAPRLSGEARDESTEANAMLKDISKLEQELPSTLKDGVDTMASVLKNLTGAATMSSGNLDRLQQDVEQKRRTAEKLLKEGRASGLQAEQLLDRVRAAQDVTNTALQGFQGSFEDLNASLSSLKGFNQQISSHRDAAAAAAKRLDGIKADVQEATRSNGETQAVLKDISEDFQQSLDKVQELNDLLSSVEGTFKSLPAHSHLLAGGTKLKKDSEDLKIKVDRTDGDLKTELDAARRLEAQSEQAADEAAGALTHSLQAGAAVAQTLKDINGLLAQMNQTGVVDQAHLQQLGVSLDSAQKKVEQHLSPWFNRVVQQEDLYKQRLSTIDADIDNVLADTENLKDILASIPEGCFKTSPVEKP